MARTRRSAKMDTRNARLRLERGRRHMVPISVGHYLVYRRPKSGAAGSWQACFVNPETKKQTRGILGVADDFEDANGKSVLNYVQANAVALSWFRAQERKANIESEGETVPDGPFTVSDAMDAYFKDAERRGIKGVDKDRGMARYWILPAFGHVQVSRLTRARIEKWLDDIANTPKRLRSRTGRPSKEAAAEPMTADQERARKCTANRVLCVLKAALTHCIDRGLADSPDRPWQLVKRYRGTDKARIRFLTPEEQIQFVNACQGDFKDLVRGALLTGCRYGEMTRLQCRDYDQKNGTVFVAESKSGKSRHIYLTDEGKELFDRLTKGRKPDDFVFTNGDEGRLKVGPEPSQWRYNEQSQKMRQAYKAANMAPVTFHELRHTYASTLVNRGCPMAVVAQLLGHANTRVTEQHYAHLARSTVRDELLRSMPRLGIVGGGK